MIILGLLLTLVALGFLCWVLFQLAVLALPFFAAVTVGLAVIHGGGGPLGGVVLGMLTGILTLVAGQLVFTLVPSALVRALVAILFVLPAVVAGYHAAHGLVAISTSSEAWRVSVGVVGAVMVGATAFSRLILRVPGPAASQVALG